MAGICAGKREYPKEYQAWLNMKARCDNPNNPAYENYGGRGISYVPQWKSFWTFIREMGESPSVELTLERKDNDLGYSKENCVWATRSAQCFNRRKFSSNASGVAGVYFRTTRNAWVSVYGRDQLYQGPDFFLAVAARKSRENLVA